MQRAFVIAGIAMLTFLNGCVSNATLLPATPASSDFAVYHLGNGDDLRVIVYGEDKLSSEYHVGDNGSVTLPLIGPIKADGLTTDQFAAAIAAAFKGGGILTDPKVAVEVLNYRPFYVLGEVAKPGAFPFIPGMTLSQAIATAGGYTYRAQKSVVRITKSGKTAEQSYRVEKGTTMAVAPGDTITVPERHF